MKRVLLFVMLLCCVFLVGCDLLQTVADAVGNPAPGEKPTVVNRVLKWGAGFLPGWGGEAVLGLTTLLGLAKVKRKSKEFQVTVTGVERGFDWLKGKHEEVAALLKDGKPEEALAALADEEGFKKVAEDFAKGYKEFEAIKKAVKKARKKDSA